MPLQTGRTSDYWHNEEPICPHCDHVCGVTENEWWDLFDENGDREFTCPSCAKPFMIEVHCKYTFSTDDQSELEECSASGESAEQAGEAT
jgi:hypothetical protein